jgi:hypothetical protein
MADPQALDTTRINPYLEKGPVQWELPTQGDAQSDARPGALQTGAPPSVTPGVNQQPAFDDEGQWRQAEQIDEDTYAKNILDASGRKPLLGALTRESHPEYTKLQEAQELYRQITNPKEAKYFEPRIRALERRIQVDMGNQERKMRQERADQLRLIDAPRETAKARGETAAIMQTEIDTLAQNYLANRTSRDPKTARQADFDVVTSPLSTMSKKGPDGTVSYEPLRNAVTALSTYNSRVPNEMAVQYALTIGSPVGTDEKGNPLPGLNGVKGKGATNYKVLGQDARGNYLLEMPDTNVLRLDPLTFNNLRKARVAGYVAAQKWEAEQKEKNKPGLITRTIQALIPEKGF